MMRAPLVRSLAKLLFACALAVWSVNAEASHCAAYDFNQSGCQAQSHCYWSPGYCEGFSWQGDCWERWSQSSCYSLPGCRWTPGMCLEY